MTTENKLKLCQEIMALAIKANEMEEYNAWCSFAGHVSLLEVLITPSWVKNVDYLENWSVGDKHVYLDDDNALEKLEVIKAELIKFLEQ